MSQRVLALTDLAPDQPDWKGAVAWRLLLSLAETHFEVTVATPLDPAGIEFSHPRLQILRPVRSWRADQIPKLAKLLALHRPQRVHLFGLNSSRGWSALSVWPYVSALLQAARIPAYVTLFESEEAHFENPQHPFLKGARRITIFGEELQSTLPPEMAAVCETVPLGLGESARMDGRDRVLIPAPAEEWPEAEKILHELAELLRARPSLHARWLGGWGTWPASKKREGWRLLSGVQDRMSLSEMPRFEELMNEVRQSSEIFWPALTSTSWRARLLRALTGGSLTEPTANALSRMYAR